MPYRPRVVDAELRARLQATGAVLIEGPKACGKTATARQVARSEVRFDTDAGARRLVEMAPALVLEGETPRLFDEWQLAPDLWNHVRRAVDDRQAPGQFVLTGSAVPADDITRHTGAGRVGRMQMRPMSLYETGVSTGAASLRELMRGGTLAARGHGLAVPDLADHVVRGGWPGLLDLSLDAARRVLLDYVNDISRTDIQRVDGVRRDPQRVAQFLRSLARHVGSAVGVAELARDAGAQDVNGIKADTAREYLDALTRLGVIEDCPPWTPHLRSRAVVRSVPTRYFIDPSLAAAALRATPAALLRDLHTFGFLFESLVLRDLRVFAQANDMTVRNFRDNTGLEVDAVVTSDTGAWGAFEIKLGERQVDAAAETLHRYAAKVDGKQHGAPQCLGVIVPTPYGYRRPDGVSVIPVDALGP